MPAYGIPNADAECMDEAPQPRAIVASMFKSQPQPRASKLAMLEAPRPTVSRPAVARPAVPAPAPPLPLPQPQPQPQPLAAPATQGWQLKAADRTLKTALLRWAASEGWQLVWEAPVDYAVERDTTIGGSFEQAIEAVAHSMAGAETPLQAIFYKGNRVIRIVAKGAQS
ncbi:pili assembly chaperone [Massilia atriviolacea]|uniref:Pili assembly chaperone n=2 Tax=Massilia atriviolacea TaxID=2495579 RepID=A0A430HUC5_9BURK|nr:pili assembly chaperone [Massilia atriviolacea]